METPKEGIPATSSKKRVSKKPKVHKLKEELVELKGIRKTSQKRE
jgi:hypothetical protein